MNQLDVCENLIAEDSQRAPYLLVLQSDYLSGADARVVTPLVRLNLMNPVRRLNPVFVIAGQSLALSTIELTSTHRRWIGKKVADLQSEREKIIAAIDMLFTGF
jgi:toxin CcdB